MRDQAESKGEDLSYEPKQKSQVPSRRTTRKTQQPPKDQGIISKFESSCIYTNGPKLANPLSLFKPTIQAPVEANQPPLHKPTTQLQVAELSPNPMPPLFMSTIQLPLRKPKNQLQIVGLPPKSLPHVKVVRQLPLVKMV
jgi:hypothetical protein